MEKIGNFESYNDFLSVLSIVHHIQKRAEETIVSLVKKAGGRIDGIEDLSLSIIDYDGIYEVKSIEIEDKDDIVLYTIKREDGCECMFWWYEFEQDIEAVRCVIETVFGKVG